MKDQIDMPMWLLVTERGYYVHGGDGRPYVVYAWTGADALERARKGWTGSTLPKWRAREIRPRLIEVTS